jgi:TonB family protein
MKRVNLSYFVAVALIVSAISTKSLFASGSVNTRSGALPVSADRENLAEIDSVVVTGAIMEKNLRSYIARPNNGENLTTVLEENIKYPEDATENDITGIVRVELTVDRNGSVSEAKVMKSPDRILSDEVMNAIKSIHFEPVIQNGYALRYKIIIPVRFDLR